MTVPRSYHVSTEKGWKSVLLGNLNRFNLDPLRLKELIPIEHDLGLSTLWTRMAPIKAGLAREGRLSSWFSDGTSCEHRNASNARRVVFILRKCTVASSHSSMMAIWCPIWWRWRVAECSTPTRSLLVTYYVKEPGSVLKNRLPETQKIKKGLHSLVLNWNGNDIECLHFSRHGLKVSYPKTQLVKVVTLSFSIFPYLWQLFLLDLFGVNFDELRKGEFFFLSGESFTSFITMGTKFCELAPCLCTQCLASLKGHSFVFEALRYLHVIIIGVGMF